MAAPSIITNELRAIRAAGVAGLIFATFLTTALVIFKADPVVSSGTGGTVLVSDLWFLALYLVPFAGIAFLWFLAVMRRRIGRSEDQFFATVFLGSGLLFIAMLFAADATVTAVVTVARAEGAPATDPAYVFGRALAQTLFYVFAIKMAAVFMLVSSNIGRRTGFLPRWFVGVGIVCAVIMLISVGFIEIVALIFPAWVAVVSILLLRAHPNSWATAEHEVAPAPAPTPRPSGG